MTLANISNMVPNLLAFSLFLYFILSCEKSCLSLLIMQKFREIFEIYNNKNENNDDDLVDDQEEPKTKTPVKFEDKYLDKMKSMVEVDMDNERLASLKNSFIMENTPQGNVIMYWDNERETFTYYADHIIPYRFLEVVGRKYVITNDCKKIFVDMEEELKEAEKKIEEKKKKLEKEKEKEKEIIEAQMNDSNNTNNTNNINTNKNVTKEESKRNVFAKLKSYNRDNSIQTATVALDSKKPPSQSAKSTRINTKETDEKILKERANRYSYGGKMTNFSFLKKVNRRAVDKNYALSFSEFKKMQLQNVNKDRK